MAVMLAAFLWPRPVFMSLVMLVWGYLSVRLVFWSVAIVVDGRGFVRGARDAWELARGSWWRLAGLTILIVGAERAAGRWLPAPYLSITAKWLIGIVGEAATAMLYLQRVGVVPRRPTLGDIVTERAARRHGIGELAVQ